jgi:hypothetical protein
MFSGLAINVLGGPLRDGQVGGYVVSAGSTHATGAVYSADNDLDPAPMPTWLIEALTGAGEPFTTTTGPFELPEIITSSAIHGRDPPSRRSSCGLLGSLRSRRPAVVGAITTIR